MGDELSEDMGDGCFQKGTLSDDIGDGLRGRSAVIVVGWFKLTVSTGKKRS